MMSSSPMILSSSHFRGRMLITDASPMYDAIVIVQAGHHMTSMPSSPPSVPEVDFLVLM